MASFTPGPWIIETEAAGGAGFVKAGSRMIFGDGIHIATVPMNPAGYPSDVANAALIATAPESWPPTTKRGGRSGPRWPPSTERRPSIDILPGLKAEDS